MNSISLAVYSGASLASSALPDASGAVTRARNRRFSTALPGGFISCNFTCELADPSAWDVEKGRFVKVYSSLDSVFEGQIEDIGYRRDRATGMYTATVTALGPWAQAKHVVEAANYAVATTGNAVIIAALAEMSNISTDTSLVTAADENVNTVNYNGTVASVIEDVLKYGNSSDAQVYFAFWETPQTGTSTAGPRAKCWARDTSTIHWRVRLSEIDFEYTDSLGNCYNAVVASYNAGGNVTAETTDATSQTLYGERQTTITVETQTLAVAEQARDVYLAARADPVPLLSPFTVIGTCRDGGGVPRPVALVRAGDVMTIEDWLDGYTFVIGATDCAISDDDPSRDSVRITPEDRPKTLSAMLGALS